MNSRFSKVEMKAYRKLYEQTVEELAIYINERKSKRVSEEAKNLLKFDKVYKKFKFMTGMLAASVGFSFVLIIYLYTEEEETALYTVSALAAVGAFLLIRHTQNFSSTLDTEVRSINKTIKKLMKLISTEKY